MSRNYSYFLDPGLFIRNFTILEEVVGAHNVDHILGLGLFLLTKGVEHLGVGITCAECVISSLVESGNALWIVWVVGLELFSQNNFNISIVFIFLVGGFSIDIFEMGAVGDLLGKLGIGNDVLGIVDSRN